VGVLAPDSDIVGWLGLWVDGLWMQMNGLVVWWAFL
jgi:hypothetical protein